MKERILKNWHIQRVIYLLIGVFISGYAITNKEWMGLLPGIYFASMAIFHFGCATGGCYVPVSKTREPNGETTEPIFEEIKKK